MRCGKSVRCADETGSPTRPADWGAVLNARLLLARHPPSQSVSTSINVGQSELLTPVENIFFEPGDCRTSGAVNMPFERSNISGCAGVVRRRPKLGARVIDQTLKILPCAPIYSLT